MINLDYHEMCWQGDQVPITAGLIDLITIGMFFATEAESPLPLLWAVPSGYD